MKARPDEPGEEAGSCGSVELPHTIPARPRPEGKTEFQQAVERETVCRDQVTVQQREPEKCIERVTET